MKMLINYKIIGKGKAVVLLHGFMENNKMWEEISKTLSEDFLVIMPDLLGHGKTPSISENHSMETQAKKTIELLDELNIKKATFIGHSMGGYISMVIAKNHADRMNGLCLLNSHTMADSIEKKKQRLKSIDIIKKNKDSFINHSISLLFNQEKLNSLQKEIDTAKKWALETDIDGIIASINGMRNREDTTELLNELSIPILMILGKKDNGIDMDNYIKLIPKKDNIQIKLLETAHMSFLEEPKASLNTINNFAHNCNKSL